MAESPTLDQQEAPDPPPVDDVELVHRPGRSPFDWPSRPLARIGSIASTVIACAWMLFHIAGSWTLVLPGFLQLTLVLMFALALVFIWNPVAIDAKTGRRPLWAFALDLVLFLFAMASTGVIAVDHETLQLTPSYSNLQITVGIGLVLVCLEGTRRVLGWALPAFAILCIAFAYTGADIFGPFSHPTYTTERIFAVLSLSRQGIYSIPLVVVGTFLALYMLLAAIMQVSGTGNFFVEISSALFGRRRGGVAKVAMLSSASYGMISGAGVANVATTGAFTIPMMTRAGFNPRMAAAIEGVSSIGGQVMPPVMGAVAFIIASYLGIGYGEVILAALLPAVFYYWALYWVIDIESRRSGRPATAENVPRAWRVLRTGGYHVVPLLVILWGFLIAQYSPARVGLYALISAFLVSWVRADTRIGLRGLVEVLVSGARMLVQLVMAVATVGIVVGVFSLTGVGLKLSGALVDLAGGSLLLLLIYTMIASIILGTGLPTTPTYLILAILVAPALGEAGISLLAAHMFIFYYGVLGDLTPPLAVAPMVAAQIAGENPWSVTWLSFRIGLSAWFLPFMFVYNEGMLLQGGPFDIATAIVSGLLGMFMVAAATMQHLFRPLAVWETGLAMVGAAMFVWQERQVSLAIGTAIFAYLLITQMLWQRRHGDGATPVPETATMPS